jgi:integrase
LVTYEGPKLSAALETYLRLKGAGRPTTFETGSRRAIGYLLDVTADKPIDAFVRSEANALREYLRGRGLAQDSIARNLTSIRAVVNFVLKEEGLPPNQAFSGVYLGEPENKKKRYVPTVQELKKLQLFCQEADDELRWLLALISDTGLRLSEALGLCREDVVLEGETPYIRIEPKPWRRLKTSESQRDVPLVGAALWAVERAMDQVETKFLFPAYCSTAAVKSNSASASLNKWLKTNVSKEAVVHSMRHLMRDRLRQVGCPSEVIDAIGGWAQRSIGEKYGSGYDLANKATWLERCVEGEC